MSNSLNLDYQLVKQKAGWGTNKGKEVYIARPVHGKTVSITTLCRRISDASTVNSADVKAVLDRFLFVLEDELARGNIVRLGELGSFSLGFGSKPVDEVKDFSTNLIRNLKINFRPARDLKLSLAIEGAEFRRVTGRKAKETERKASASQPPTPGAGASNPESNATSGSNEYSGL